LNEEHDAKTDPDARHLLSRIQNGVTNMTELVDGLLRMSQIGRTELVCVATDLNSLLEDVVADLQPEWENRHVDWHIGDLRPLDCDPGLIKQVFIYLISNAIKYTRRREIARIEVGQIEQEGESVIFARDNGAGFD